MNATQAASQLTAFGLTPEALLQHASAAWDLSYAAASPTYRAA